MPFYSHTVSYEADYRVDKGAGRILVGLGKWHGTVAEVLVNGKSAGIIGSQPYEIDISALVQPGVNHVGVVVYGSLKCAGPYAAGDGLRPGRLRADGAVPGGGPHYRARGSSDTLSSAKQRGRSGSPA